MKIIRLKSVLYVNYKGIVLTTKNPSIEATEENLEKLSVYIGKGFVEVYDTDDFTVEKVAEKIADVIKAPISEEFSGINVEIERVEEEVKTYTEEELKAMNKAQLLELCKDLGLDVKKSTSVSKLEEIILNHAK